MRLGGLAAMDRLQQLIFSFYREDPELQERLEPLRSCRMRRSWGSIRIECIDDCDGLLEESSVKPVQRAIVELSDEQDQPDLLPG